MRVRIEKAVLYDPSQGLMGEPGELCFEHGRIVESVENPDLVVDARRGATLPGGIELSSPVGSPVMAPMLARGSLEGLKALSESYMLTGYTHVNVRWVPLWAAGAAHWWLSKLSALDCSLEVLVNLRDIDSLIKDDEDAQKGTAHGAFLMDSARAAGLSVAEPFVRYLEDYLSFRQVDVPAALAYLARVAGNLGVRITVAFSEEVVHNLTEEAAKCFHLARVPGEAAQGLRGFFEAGGTADLVVSEGAQGLALDAGLFNTLGHISQEPYHEEDLPVAVAALPREGRDEVLTGFCEKYGPGALALATRTAPARALGLLPEKGTLAPGAGADVAVFGPEEGLGRCRYLFKSGVMVLEDGRPTGLAPERFTYVVSPGVAAEPSGVLPGSFRPENLGAVPDLPASVRKVPRDVSG